jgi:small subunit ribosomal protein S7
MSTSKSRRTKISPDPIYNSLLVTLLVLRILRSGKKFLAQNIVYQSFQIIQNDTGESPIFVFEKAVKNVTPRFIVKSRRMGARINQVPCEVRAYRGVGIGLKWIVASAKKRSGRSMANNLAQEILLASKGSGASFQEKVKLQKKYVLLAINALPT